MRNTSTSGCPAVVRNAVLAAVFVRIALVARVVPWMTVSQRLSSSAAESPSAAAARRIASRMPSIGSCGVVGALCSVSRPSACRTTTSVNVPPVSIASFMSVVAADRRAHLTTPPSTTRCVPVMNDDCVGGQEQHRLGDLLRLGFALQRDDRRHGLEEHLVAAADVEERVVEAGAGVAGTDAIDADRRGKLGGQGAREPDHGALGGRVVGRARRPSRAGRRSRPCSRSRRRPRPAGAGPCTWRPGSTTWR